MMQMPILFFYGISFLFLYVIISVMPKQKDPLNLYNDIWFVGIFGLIHGLHEFMEFFIIVGEPFDVRLLKVIGSLLLPASFIFLIIFSTRVIIRRMPSFRWLRTLWLVCLSVWAAISILCRDFLIAGIAARYFVALPATLLVSFALYAAVSKADKKQIPRDVYISTVAVIATFSIYGILTGFVVPKADFLLARFINYPNFISFFGLPVQFFRMICAIIITAGCMGMFRLFHHERITIKILLLMGAAIFLVELGIMFILARIFSHLPMVTEAFLDSTLLTVLLYPLIYVMVLVPLFTEITERKKAEEEIKRNYDLQNVLNSLLKFSLKVVTIDEVLRYTLDLVLSITWLSFEHKGSIFLVEDEPHVLVMKAQKGVSEFTQKSCARVPFGRCLCGQAALTKKVQFVNHVDERHETRYKGITPHGHYSVPVISSDKVFGVLHIYIREGHSYNQKEEDFLSAIANTLVGVIERKKAENELKKVLLWQQGVDLLQQSLLAPGLLEDKLKVITDSIVRLFDVDFCRIWLIRPGDLCEQGCMHAEVKEGPHICRFREKCLHLLASSSRYTHIDGKGHARVPFGCYEIGRVVSGEDHKFLTNNAQNDPRVHNHEWARELGLVSFAGYQLRPPGRETLGVLALFAKHPILPTEDAILDGISTAIAFVVEQAVAEKEINIAYLKLKEMQEQIIQLEKMASIGQLAAGVAHEINNPLTAISGEAEILLRYKNTNEDTKESLKIIVEQAQRIKMITERLLVFSHKREFKREPLDINKVVEKSVALLNYQAEMQGIKIIKQLDFNFPEVLGDSSQLQEVFLNIMLNAVQAMEKEGELTIKTHMDKIKEGARRKTDIFKQGQEAVVIEFKDTGKGMDEETLRKAFDPFFSTKEKNTGLGLSICYGIIKDHKGIIEAYSKLKEGSTFIVKLPVYKKGG